LVCPPAPDQPDVPLVERKFAHSDRLVLPRITAPAARSRLTSQASFAGGLARIAREPAVVSCPLVSTLSLSSTGMPSSGPRVSPRSRRRSLAAAWATAVRSTASTAWILPSSARIRAR
jgi:hypothetical protein